AGVLNVAVGANTNTIGVTFVNTGTVTVQSGTLSLTDGGTLAGLMTNASGTTLEFDNGTFTVLAGFSATGPGALVINNGYATVNFNNPAGSTVPHLELIAGTLGGTGPVTINGPFTWSGGTINNTGGVTLAGASSLDGVGNESMDLVGLLINAGALSWGGSGANL